VTVEKLIIVSVFATRAWLAAERELIIVCGVPTQQDAPTSPAGRR
jgi:hypothetical protein